VVRKNQCFFLVHLLWGRRKKGKDEESEAGKKENRPNQNEYDALMNLLGRQRPPTGRKQEIYSI